MAHPTHRPIPSSPRYRHRRSGDHDQKLSVAGFNLRLIKPADPMALLAVLERGVKAVAG